MYHLIYRNICIYVYLYTYMVRLLAHVFKSDHLVLNIKLVCSFPGKEDTILVIKKCEVPF